MPGERGVVGGVEVLPFGLLVFGAGTLLILNCFTVIDAKLAVSSAAREGVRSAIEAPDPQEAESRSFWAARASFAASGHAPNALEIKFAESGGTRCGTITVATSYRVVPVRLPIVGGFGGAIIVRARRAERLDRYRSGLTGSAACSD